MLSFQSPCDPTSPTYLPSSFKVLQSGKERERGKFTPLISVDLIPIPGIQDSSKKIKKKKAITSSSWSKINQYLNVKHFIFGLLQVQRIFDSNDVLLKRYLCFGLWHNLPWPKGQFYPVGVILNFKLGNVYLSTAKLSSTGWNSVTCIVYAQFVFVNWIWWANAQ